MIKDMLISAMLSVLIIERVPWFAGCQAGEKVGIFAGLYVSFIIFCIFWENTASKWRNGRRRRARYRRRRRR